MSESNVTNRLFTIRYKCDEQSHLSIKSMEACKSCGPKVCTHICPSDVYEWVPERTTMMVSYENCLECGTCRIACSQDNIAWSYMTGGHGIAYRYG